METFIEGRAYGDSISPLIFVFVMEYLTRILLFKAKQHPFRHHPLRKDMKLTNLCFADDLLIFSKGHLHTIQLIMEVIQQFSNTTGLSGNTQKSHVYMAGINAATQQQILHLIGLPLGTFPVKYLGIPLSPRKWSTAKCHALVEKITKRINIWTTRHLSYAGRVQLINSILFSLNTY